MNTLNTITRRTAIAVPVTLPLLPIAAYATPADPAVEAYRVWRAAEEAFERSYDRPGDLPDDDPIVKAAYDAHLAAILALCDTTATTPEGLAGQVRHAFYTFGDVGLNGDWHNPEEYQIDGFGWDQGGRLLRSMLAGAEGMAKA